MANQWGYVDPVERVHQLRPMWSQESGWAQSPWTPPVPPAPSGPVIGDIGMAQALYGNGPRHNPLLRATIGAVIGNLIGRWIERRLRNR